MAMPRVQRQSNAVRQNHDTADLLEPRSAQRQNGNNETNALTCREKERSMNIRPEIADLAKPINDFTTHPRNVRQGDIGAICESLDAHGQYRPIVVQRSTGFILAGNHTWMAAKQLGWQQVAATFVDCDDAQALRILLVDNRANDLAMYDDKALADVLRDLTTTELGLDGSLFSGDDLDDLLYRLEGSAGLAQQGTSLSDEADNYAAHDTRSLVIPMAVAEFTQIVAKLAEIRKSLDLPDNSAAIKHLVDDAYENLTS